jgi:hypothetical protein
MGPVLGQKYHKLCFRCNTCNRQLDFKSYRTNLDDLTDRNVYCSAHNPKSKKFSETYVIYHQPRSKSPAATPSSYNYHAEDSYLHKEETNNNSINNMRYSKSTENVFRDNLELRNLGFERETSDFGLSSTGRASGGLGDKKFFYSSNNNNLNSDNFAYNYQNSHHLLGLSKSQEELEVVKNYPNYPPRITGVDVSRTPSIGNNIDKIAINRPPPHSIPAVSEVLTSSNTFLANDSSSKNLIEKNTTIELNKPFFIYEDHTKEPVVCNRPSKVEVIVPLVNIPSPTLVIDASSTSSSNNNKISSTLIESNLNTSSKNNTTVNVVSTKETVSSVVHESSSMTSVNSQHQYRSSSQTNLIDSTTTDDLNHSNLGDIVAEIFNKDARTQHATSSNYISTYNKESNSVSSNHREIPIEIIGPNGPVSNLKNILNEAKGADSSPQQIVANNHNQGGETGNLKNVMKEVLDHDRNVIKSPVVLPDIDIYSSVNKNDELFKKFGEIIGQDRNFGLVRLTIHYDELRSRLSITIHEARHLKNLDKSGVSDPYARVYLLPDDKPSNKRKTKIIKNNLNPIWQETFDYPISFSQALKKYLIVNLKDERGLFERQDSVFMGEVVLNLESLPSITQPYTRWFFLQPLKTTTK